VDRCCYCYCACRAITVTGFRRVLSRMRVCALSGPLLQLRKGSDCHFERRLRQSDYVVFLSRVIACLRWRVVVLGGGGVTHSCSCVPTYLRSVCLEFWTLERRARCSRCVRKSGGAADRYIFYSYIIYYVTPVFPLSPANYVFVGSHRGLFPNRTMGGM